MLLGVTPAQAQFLKPSFRNYTVDDGLPSSEVYITVQDHDGYMWFGTDNGLSRFDGYKFKNYGTKEGLLNPVIFDMFVDDDGKLWMLTMSGNIYIHDNGRIYPYEYNVVVRQYANRFRYAIRFHKDTEDAVSIGFVGMNILTVNRDGSRNFLRLNSDEFDLVIRDYGHKIIYSRRSNSDVKAPDNYAHNIYLVSNDTTIHHVMEKGITQTLGITPMKLDSTHILLNFGNDLFSIIEDKIILNQDDRKSLQTVFTNDEEIWYGYGDNCGVGIYNATSLAVVNALKGASISNIYKDRQHNLWITSNNFGVYYYNRGEVLENSNYFSDSNSDFRSIAIKDSINLFIGLYTEKRYELDVLHNKIIELNDPQIENSGNDLGAMHYSRKNSALVNGSNLVLFKNNYWFIPASELGYGYRIKTLGSSTNEYDDKILVNAHDRTLEVDLSREHIVSHFLGHITRVTSCNYNSRGEKYIGRVDGIWQWIGDTLIRPTNCHPYMKERIESIEFLANGNFVLGTKGRGVLVWDRKEIVHQITEQNGLTSDMIENIFIDSLDQIWVGTLNGLNRIRIQEDNTLRVKQFTKKHGLPGNEINKVRRQGEHIWVATTTGLGRIKDEEPDTTTTTPIISNFVINGTSTLLEAGHKLNYDENNMRVDFVALDYKAQGDIPYRYRLRAGEEWQYTKNRTLNFPDLSPSTYQIEIQAQNEDGFWSSSVEQTFSIKPPLWQRLWFITLLVLSSSGVIYMYVRRRQKATIQKLKEEHSIQSQIIDLERSALQAQMNPHFIFNILNSIQLSINQNQNETASQLLAKFAKLIRSTLQNAKTKWITLEEEFNYIQSYLYLEQIRYKEEIFKYEITKDPELDTSTIMLPPMLVQPYVENAVKHGTRNVSSAHIKVHYTYDKSEILVTIEDNGPGLNTNTSKSQHKSMGMDITKRRLELHNLDSSREYLSINQLKDEKGNIIGTKIELRIKSGISETI